MLMNQIEFNQDDYNFYKSQVEEFLKQDPKEINTEVFEVAFERYFFYLCLLQKI
jgi:hypothetical protein